MWKKNSQYHKDLLKYHSGNNHMSLKKKPEEHGSLADQIREKIQWSTFETINIAPSYDIDFVSKTFWQIRLRELRDPDYTVDAVRWFFSALDFVSDIYVVVEDRTSPYIDDESFFVVKLGTQKYTLPVPLFRLCIPKEVKSMFKGYWSFYRVYRALFSSYGRNMIPTQYK